MASLSGKLKGEKSNDGKTQEERGKREAPGQHDDSGPNCPAQIQIAFARKPQNKTLVPLQAIGEAFTRLGQFVDMIQAEYAPEGRSQDGVRGSSIHIAGAIANFSFTKM